MFHDVGDIREFYETSLGQVTRRLIRRRVRELWPDTRGLVVCGVGYAVPYLRPFREEAERAIAVMPAAQGCTYWPREGPGLVALADEAELPLPDMSVDRMLVVHGLEFTEHLRQMLREAWRVLAGGGRMIVVAPNRRGMWARTERTPFGHGYPYSPSQLKRTLKDNLFQPERSAYAVYVPPMRSRFMLASAPAWEEVGSRWFQHFSGVYICEATKQIYAAAPRASAGARLRARARAVAVGAEPRAAAERAAAGDAPADQRRPTIAAVPGP
jgi:SAM-dependent methyltransferase